MYTISLYKKCASEKQFTNYIKFSLQYNKKKLLLSDSSNLRKLVKSVVLDGKLFHMLTIRLLKKLILLLLEHRCLFMTYL